MFRQGDVLIIPVRKGLKKGKAVPRENGRVVLAHGEVTGHSHAIAEEDAALMVLDDRAEMESAVRELLSSAGLTVEFRDEELVGVLSTPTGGAVVHEEHGTIPLVKGNAVILRQRQYAPEEIRQVLD